MHLGWNLISHLIETRSVGLQTQIHQKKPFSTFQQSFLWFFFIFSTFEKLLKILVFWVLIWFFLCFCLTTQRNILPILKSFGGRLSIPVVIPFVMPISPQLMLFGAWLGETQVHYNHLTLRLIGHSTEEVGILGIHLCMLNIQWHFLILLILITFLTLLILCILSILHHEWGHCTTVHLW